MHPSRPLPDATKPEAPHRHDPESWEWDLVPFWRLAPDEQPLAREAPHATTVEHGPEPITPAESGRAAPVSPLPYSWDWGWDQVAPDSYRLPDEQPHATELLPEVAAQEWDEQEPAAKNTIQWRPLLHELLETVILTLLIFVVMRALVQNYRIEGYSMEPNLHEGQRLFVNKFVYYFGEPQRGDIIVFEYDRDEKEKDFIKRIIGLPGDTVACEPGQIIVNGEAIAEPYGPNLNSYSCTPMTLGPEEYFVLGDNRNQSSDSHAWGPLERKYIIGKAWVVYWPLEDFGGVPNYPIEAPDPQPLVQVPSDQ
jgi:signal peptidase I